MTLKSHALINQLEIWSRVFLKQDFFIFFSSECTQGADLLSRKVPFYTVTVQTIATLETKNRKFILELVKLKKNKKRKKNLQQNFAFSDFSDFQVCSPDYTFSS